MTTPGAVLTISVIEPQNDGDFPVVADTHVKGGFHAVASIAERDAIPFARRTVGMRVVVTSTTPFLEFELTSASPASWSSVTSSGGAVTSVNGQTGAVTITAAGLGAVSSSAFADHVSSATAHGISGYGASLVSAASASGARAILGLGSAAVAATTDFTAAGTAPTSAAFAAHVSAATAHGISGYGASLVSAASASGARTILGLGSAAVASTTDFSPAGATTSADFGSHVASVTAHGISGYGASLVSAASAAGARSILGLGSAAVASTTDFTPANTAPTSAAFAAHVSAATAHGISGYGASLVSAASASGARTILGLGSAAVAATTDFAASNDLRLTALFSTSSAGLTPRATSTTAFLRGDGSWATPSGGALADGAYGDVTVTGTGATITVNAGVITTSKLGGDITTAGKALLDDADAAAQRVTMGATASADFGAHVSSATAHGISGYGASLVSAASASGARTILGLGSAAVASTTDFTAAGAAPTSAAFAAHVSAATAHGISGYGASLISAASASGARTILGLGSAAVAATTDFAPAGATTSADFGAHVASVTAHGISGYGASLVSAASATGARSILGLGSAAVASTTDFTPANTAPTSAAFAAHVSAATAHGISGYGASLVSAASASGARTILGLGSAAVASTTDFAASNDLRLTALFSTSSAGLVPTATSTTAFLRGDGTWATPPGGGLSDGDKGDITVSGSAATFAINAGRVAFVSLASMFASRLLGRPSSGDGAPQEISLDGLVLGMNGSVLTTVIPPAGTTAFLMSVTGASRAIYASPATVTSVLDTFDTARRGVVPAATSTTQFLRGDGTWATPAGGGLSDGDYGDVTVSGSGTTLSVTRIRPLDVLALQVSAATAGTVGFIHLGATYAGGRHMASVTGPSGLSVALQPSIARNKISWWAAPGNTTTAPTAVGNAALTATGTATARAVATTDLLSGTRRLGYVSGATLNGTAGYRLTNAPFWLGNGAGRGGFHYIEFFAVSDAVHNATAQWFHGLRNSSSAPAQGDPSAFVNMIGLAKDRADTNIQFMCNDGSGVATKANTGIASGTNKFFQFEMFCPPNGSTVAWSVVELISGSAASGFASTNLPGNTTFLTPNISVSTGSTATAVAHDLLSLYIETDY